MNRALVLSLAAALFASFASLAPAATPAVAVLRLDGIGPLRLGMTREAARATGWLAQRRTGCPLGGPPLPITYRLAGPKAPRGIEGTAEFAGERLRSIALTRGVRTAAWVEVGRTSVRQMVLRSREAGLGARSRYDSTFAGTFVTVGRNGRQVLGGFAEAGVVTVLGIPYVPVCE